jgi:hypothetical protein
MFVCGTCQRFVCTSTMSSSVGGLTLVAFAILAVVPFFEFVGVSWKLPQACTYMISMGERKSKLNKIGANAPYYPLLPNSPVITGGAQPGVAERRRPDFLISQALQKGYKISRYFTTVKI